MRRLLILAFLSAVCSAQITGTYEIFSDGSKVGECHFRFEKRPTGFVLVSKTTMTISGAQSIYEAETQLDQGYHPRAYSVEITTPSGKQDVFVKFEEGKASITGSAGLQRMSQELDFPTGGYVADQNVFAHFWVLGKVIDPMVGNVTLDVIVPQIFSACKLKLRNEEERDFDGKKASVFVGKLGANDVELVVSEDRELLSVSFPEQRLEAKLAGIEEVTEAERRIPKNYHPLTPQDLGDRSFVKRLLRGKRLEGHISFDPHGRLDRVYLNRRAQTFVGTIDEGGVDGDIKCTNISHRVTLAPEWPLSKPFSVAPEYISPAPGIDSDDDGVKEQAARIVSEAPTLWEAARAINLWVNKNVEYVLERYDARDALVKARGDCLTKAMLCVAMLRAVGIPARVVQGILYADVPLDHSWVEVYLGPEIGWAPLDPTTGEVDRLSARHISLWLGEQAPPVFAEDVELEVKKFK